MTWTYRRIAKGPVMRSHSDGEFRAGRPTINVENKYMPSKEAATQIEVVLTFNLDLHLGGHDVLAVAHLTPQQLETLIEALQQAHKDLTGYRSTTRDMGKAEEW